MSYHVQQVDEVYADPDRAPEEQLEAWLNEGANNGFRLVAVLPDHQHWDTDGKPQGKSPAMLIMQRDD